MDLYILLIVVGGITISWAAVTPCSIWTMLELHSSLKLDFWIDYALNNIPIHQMNFFFFSGHKLHKTIVKKLCVVKITRGVTIHRYIDTMYDDTMHRCHAYNIDICSIKRHLYLALSTFSYNGHLCITTNACILVQSHVSELDIRTARRHKVSI